MFFVSLRVKEASFKINWIEFWVEDVAIPEGSPARSLAHPVLYILSSSRWNSSRVFDFDPSWIRTSDLTSGKLSIGSI